MGIILNNGETFQNVDYLRKIGVTHVLNIVELHVSVNPDKYCYVVSLVYIHVTNTQQDLLVHKGLQCSGHASPQSSSSTPHFGLSHRYQE